MPKTSDTGKKTGQKNGEQLKLDCMSDKIAINFLIHMQKTSKIGGKLTKNKM